MVMEKKIIKNHLYIVLEDTENNLLPYKIIVAKNSILLYLGENKFWNFKKNATVFLFEKETIFLKKI